MSLADISDLRNVGPQSITEILRLAVERALSVSAGSFDEAGSRNNQELESPPNGREDNISQHALPSNVKTALETLTAWGRREQGLATLGALLAELGNAVDLPEDVAHAWEMLYGYSVADFAEPGEDTPLTELLDEVLARLDEREREIFVGCSLKRSSANLQDFAARWDVSVERVRQIQVRAESKVADVAAEMHFAPLRWRAHTLRSALGGAISMASDTYSTAMDRALESCRAGRRPVLRNFLLRLAGYSEQSGWIVRQDAPIVTSEMLESAADEFGILDMSRVAELLEEAAITPANHIAFLERIGGFRKFGDRLAIWKGTMIDKAVRVLALRGKPMTPDDLAAVIGEGTSVRSLRNRMLEDHRLARVTKNEWALRIWGVTEYTGVADKIAEEIGRQGGSASLSHLVETIATEFDVAPSSVRAYAQAPRFVVESGIVRLRTNAEPFVVSAQIADAKGCFQVSPTSVSFCFKVDKDVQRGSGRSLPIAVAAFVGVFPDNKRQFRTIQTRRNETTNVVMTWSIDSIVGPSLGSTRALAIETRAIEGDLLRLQFDRVEGTVQAFRLTPRELSEATPITRLSALTGILDLDELNAADRIAASIGVGTSELRSRLYRRGDGSLVELLPVASVDPALDAALAELSAALESGA
jgi:hypothetical protein